MTRRTTEKLFLNRALACVAATLAVVLLVGLSSRVNAQIWQVDPEIKDALRLEKLNTVLIPAMKEHGINLWLVFDRDADDERVNMVWEDTRKVHLDPISEHIGTDGIYQPGAFLFSDTGERVAIVSKSDRDVVGKSGVYTKTVTYQYSKRKGFEEIFDLLRTEVERLDPKTIGLNWSEYEPMADGLTVGMYRLLEEVLGQEMAGRFVSAEDVVVSLLGRNTPTEVAYLRQSAEISKQLMEEAMRMIRPGVTTERDIFNFMRFRMEQLGVEPGWSEYRSPIVTVGGPRSGRVPGDEKVEPGRLVKINGGVRVKGLSVDINMNAYVLRPGETAPPPTLQHMWDTVVRATQASVEAIKPGMRCHEVDAIARRVVREAGYEEWGYELAHSVGAWIHGIGPTLGPKWSHFGRKTDMAIQVNDTYAVEPAVGRFVPEMGSTVRVHVQEMVLVEHDGAHYMVAPQTELMLIPPGGSSPTSR